MRGFGASLLPILAGFAGAAILVGLGSHGVSAHSARTHSGKSLPTAQLFPPNVRSEQADAVEVQAAFGRLPLHFEAHEGQTFLTRAPGYTLILRPSEARVAVDRPDPKSSATTKVTHRDVRMRLLGAAQQPRTEGLAPLPGKVNYLLGDDPAKWRTGIATYQKVRHYNVYPGIDVVYYGNPNELEFDFVVAPGSQPDAIQLVFQGVGTAHIDAQGDLILGAAEAMRLRAPTLYQEYGGERQKVFGRYVLKRQTASEDEPVQVSFAVGDYDATRPLVIDPVLDFSSYLGWAGAEAASDIVRDDSGNLYITGRTNSSAGPGVTAIGPHGSRDVFVAKLDSTGSVLEYMTFLGGSLDDGVAAIDVSSSGKVALGGNTASTDFPTTPGAFSKINSGESDGFVVQLDAGGSLNYGSYLGGSGQDSVADVSTNTNGALISATGNTASANFPVKNEHQAGLSGLTDAFVALISASNANSPVNCPLNGISYHDCDDLNYSTYLGGSSFDVGHGIFVDSVDTYVTGQTCSIDFPFTSKAFDKSKQGSCDAFVTILNGGSNNNPVSVDYSTYLGGTGWDKGNAIIPSGAPAGGVLVTGETTSLDFPAMAGSASTQHAGGGYDAFVLRMDPGSAIQGCSINGLVHDNCNDLVWSSYLGGNDSDYGHALATDFWGSAYVTGQTCSADFPLVEPLAQESGINEGAACDAFVSKFAPEGSALEYSTYLGGSDSDSGVGIAVEKIGHAYVVGGTSSTNFPLENPLQPATGGGDDAFLSKLIVPCVGGGGAFAYMMPEAIDTANDCLLLGLPDAWNGFMQSGTVEGVTTAPSVSTSGQAAQVFGAGGAGVWFIDSENQQATKVPTDPNSFLGGVAVSPDGTRLYVGEHCDTYPCHIFVYDAQTHQLLESIEWGDQQTMNSGAMGIALHPDGKKLYVANYHEGDAIFVIDLEANPKTATGILLDDNMQNIGNAGPYEIAITPDGKWLYTANDYQGTGISVVDTSTDTFVQHINVTKASMLAITPSPVFGADGYLVYTTHPDHDDLVVIRTDTHAIHETIVGAGGGAISITPDGTKAYVAAYGFVKVLDLVTSPCNPCATWVDSIPVGSVPAPLGSFIGPQDRDADGIIDQVDDDPSNYSKSFSDGTSSGKIVNRKNQWVSVWDAFENGLYANARGGTEKAKIKACNIFINLDHNDAVKFLCGSLTLEVFTGQVEIDLLDEHCAAVPEGGEVKVEETFHGVGRTEGEFLLQNLGSETVSIIDAAGSILASLAPGEAKFWPSLPSTTWVVNGVAEGGAIGLTVLGVELTAATSPGQRAPQVAQAIADAIRAEPSLVGVQTTVTGNFIVITAPVDNFYTEDGGIEISVPSAIPALSPSLIALLGFALLALGYRVIRNRNIP